MTAAHQPSPGRLVTWIAGLWTAAPISSKPVVQRSTWEDATSALPVEVYEHIFSFLEPQTLITILRVCNQLHQVAARFLFARVALNSTVSFDHILTLFSGVLPQQQYGTHVRTFLIDLAAERERSAPPCALQPLQPFLVDMFAGGFRSLKHLRVLSLPLKLSEAFAAIYDLHFPQLERLDVRCAVPMEDLVAFVSRHAASLTHLVHPHHIAAEALESLAVLPRLMYLHATPSLVLHVLENQPEVRLQYLGILCSPPVPWGGPTRTDDDVAECLPTILDVLRTWDENPLNTLHIHEPFGFSHIRSALWHEQDVPLTTLSRLELASTHEPVDFLGLCPGIFRDIIRAIPNIGTLKIESINGQKLFRSAGPPLRFARELVESQTGVSDIDMFNLQCIVADGMCLVRTEPADSRFRHDLGGAEKRSPWLVDFV